MNIEPRSVDGTYQEYIKMGLKNIWKHQVVYLIPLLVLYPIIGILGYIDNHNRAIENLFIFFLGFYILFLYAEITFTTTQEKYTPKRYLTSWIIAGWSMVAYLKRNAAYTCLLIVMVAGIDIVYAVAGLMSINEAKETTFWMLAINHIKMHAGTKVMIDLVAYTYILGELATDFSVTNRMNGMKGAAPNTVLTKARDKNVPLLKKFMHIALLFTITAPIFYGFQLIVLMILIAGLTFYSLDVFDVDIGRKQRQEQEESEKNHMAVPSMT